MDLRLELVPVPVRDIEARPFDADQISASWSTPTWLLPRESELSN